MTNIRRVLLLTLVLLVGCTRSVTSEDSRGSPSQNHLRKAMLLLAEKKEVEAQQEFEQSLKWDPTNSKARTAYASLIAKQAGLDLSVWLDPLTEIMRRFSQFEAKVNLPAVTSLRTPGDPSQEAKEFIADLMKHAQAFSLFLDVFSKLPFLGGAQVSKLDSAIALLRADKLASTERSEESRVYLTLLATIRLVSFTKLLLGEGSVISIDAYKFRLCAMKPQEFIDSAMQIRHSLQFLEEGLVIGAKDPDTSQRKAREKVQKQISKILAHPLWASLESYFNVETPEGKIGKAIMERYCY